MTKVFKHGDKIYCGVPEKIALEGADEVPFGLLVYVILEDQREVAVKFMWEWTAEYNKEYAFSLIGSEDKGYTITQIGKDFDCKVTPWESLLDEPLE